MRAELLFLGTGASTGIPMVGCKCPICRSFLKKNKRLRPSVLLKIAKKKLLIDVAPDFREMALKYRFENLDGLLLTHIHYDHIGGLDDLRAFCLIKKKSIPCLLSKSCLQEMKSRYEYLFKKREHKTSLSVELKFQVLKKEFGTVNFEGIEIAYFSYWQKKMKVTGYRFQDVAYVTDINKYDENLLEALKGVKILILSALREKPSPVHFNFKKAIAFAKKIKAKKVYLTHIAHEVDHMQASKLLPPHMQLAFDGLRIEFDYAGKFSK